MRALLQTKDGPAFTTDQPTPKPGNEAMIRLSIGGICATDLEIVKGYMGFEGVLGHEWVGVVESAPDPAWNGARVVGDINASCGACATCRANRPTHCPNRTVLGILGRDGAFADKLTLPMANLHRVPDQVSDDMAVFVEPLAAALRIVDQVHIRPTQRVAVLGVGRLGQLCARVLALTGAEVAGISRNPARLSLLPTPIHAVHTDQVSEIGRFDVVVDCTGSPDGLTTATELTRPGGTLVLKTTVHGQTPASPTPWVIDEITVVGSRCGPFGPALRLMAAGLIDPSDLISARYALKDGVKALNHAAERDCVKVLLDP